MNTEEKALTSHRSSIRVMVVDDSKLMSKGMTRLLSKDPGIEVVAKAFDGMEALNIIENQRLDVITMDVHMPRMNGLTCLKHIMLKNPIPTIMVSSFTEEGAWVTFDALRFGAVDFMRKPQGDSPESLEAQGDLLIEKVKRASSVDVCAARFVRIQGKRRFGNKHDVGKNHKCTIDLCGEYQKALFIGGTGAYSSVLQLLSLTKCMLVEKVVFFLDVDPSYLSGFARYCSFTFGIDTVSIRPGDPIEKDLPKFIFSNSVEVLKEHINANGNVLLAGLSGEEGLFERVIQPFTGKEGLVILNQEPKTCLVSALARKMSEQGSRSATLGMFARCI